MSAPDRLKQDALSASEVSAHEFFHLWNVKRIRPQSLEPIDYTREQYSRALWFSEGVTSTAADIIQMRAGLSDEKQMLAHLASVIAGLQARSARLTQSVEESSLDTWLDPYPAIISRSAASPIIPRVRFSDFSSILKCAA